MSEKKTDKEITNDTTSKSNMIDPKSNMLVDYKYDHKMDKVFSQFEKMFDNTVEDILFEPSSVERSCYMEVDGDDIVKVELSEKRVYNFDDDDMLDDDEFDEEGVMVYSSDPSVETPKQEVVPLEVARQWNREREKIKQERIKNKPKEDIKE